MGMEHAYIHVCSAAALIDQVDRAQRSNLQS